MAFDEIALLAFVVMIGAVPIVAILTAHQRKMAEILHKGWNRGDESDLIRQEIQDLRNRLNQLTLGMDEQSRMIGRIAEQGGRPTEGELRQRIEEKQG